MLLTEYDEKKHLKHTFEEGLAKGREEKLREQVRKKRAKGMPIAQIAEELEEEISVIEQIIER